ncbi:4-nitrophenylphosphatase [Octopus sinensis]|uniref:4-nitrophenylphosphatase n=1 Tax=Octopus sinensis TaxID=2607531 RepID=A0A6P7T0D1_9MOLL|nr:4-nitrophenylphosphatase [Octopus sinensis]
MNYLLAHVDTFLFDCDGVLWRHLEPIPGASDTVKKLKKLGKNVLFVTNNSTKSRKAYCIKFSQLGFEVKESEIISTAYVAALYLHECNFKGKVYLVGSKGIADELDNFGIQHTEVGIGSPPEDYPSNACDFKYNADAINYEAKVNSTKFLVGMFEGTLKHPLSFCRYTVSFVIDFIKD